MKAEQYAEELPALHYNGLIDDTDIQAICEMLRRLAAVEAELERIKALKPVAYARFADNGNIRIWARTHAEAIAGNLPEAPPMTPLYALGSKT